MRLTALLLPTAMLVGLSSCLFSSDDPDPPSFQSISVPDNFSWSLSQKQFVNIDFSDLGLELENKRVNVRDENGSLVAAQIIHSDLSSFYLELPIGTGTLYLDIPSQNLVKIYPKNQSGDFTFGQLADTSFDPYFGNKPSISEMDSDLDGVVDSEDDAPTNPELAISYKIPYKGYKVVAMEDLWPEQGDFDFNDLVLRFNQKHHFNSENQLYKGNYELILDAVGGINRHGLGFQFVRDESTADKIMYKSLPSNIVSDVTGGETVKMHDALYTAGVYVTEDLHFIQSEFYNNNGEGPTHTPDTTRFEVSFSPSSTIPTNMCTMIYLFDRWDRGKEVHLPFFPPTSAANDAYFGTEADASIPLEDIWYKSSENHPWGIEMIIGDEDFKHTKEGVNIILAFPEFREWGRSGGDSNTDWYEKSKENNLFQD
ncbi:LruC domain-containing protein [Sediminitomix flava]|uniref:LruC domain-containing protein n=1 Tax=Sediminitomix flava TaxID=379075 RepID=A0A315ZD25_SEDFL|nr:LruC domain-containing protein [Sediminitomix flava]PWJ43019.1 LruC domain-containing protein [Sediminitomix flava]